MPARKSVTRSPNTDVIVTPWFEVRPSQIQGRGAFATRTIRKGQRIIEYTGERISNEEADNRYDETKMRRHHTFLFTLDSKTVIDGAVGGSPSIYINHSCEPNCEAVITNKRIYIHALRTIHEGEELAYDYQYERTGDNDEELARFYVCRCGAPTCRGSIMKPAKPARRPKAAAPGKGGKAADGTKRTKATKGVKTNAEGGRARKSGAGNKSGRKRVRT